MHGGELGQCWLTRSLQGYAMAPAALVAPLGAITVIANAVFSRVLLQEPMPRQKAMGVVLALIGAVMIAVGAPSELPPDVGGKVLLPEEEFYARILTWRALGYIIGLVIVVFCVSNPLKLSFLISDETRKNVVVVPCVLCGCAGTMTVAAAKAVFQMLSQAFSGNPAMLARPDICWLTYLTIIVAVGSILGQVKYLNEALMRHGSSRVVPVYYVTFTTITMSAGMVFFLEIDFTPFVLSIVLFVVGLVFAFTGVWLINSLQAEEGEGGHTGTGKVVDIEETMRDGEGQGVHIATDGGEVSARGESISRVASLADSVVGVINVMQPGEDLQAKLGASTSASFVTGESRSSYQSDPAVVVVQAVGKDAYEVLSCNPVKEPMDEC